MIREYGLIGYPLTHSFSQRYFTEKFAREGITDAVFHLFSMPAITALPGVLQEHPQLQGFAITIPYKRDVISYLQDISPEVRSMHACNCVKIRDGKLSGYNTDIIGFERSFVQHLQPHHTRALVLGTGGAAAAVQYVLTRLEIPFLLVSRQTDPASGRISYADLDEIFMSSHNIIINTTPLGTYPSTEEAPAIPYHLVTPQHYLFDLVYNPPKTRFLALGEAQGATIANGYDMLVIQAEENWKIWNQ